MQLLNTIFSVISNRKNALLKRHDSMIPNCILCRMMIMNVLLSSNRKYSDKVAVTGVPARVSW